MFIVVYKRHEWLNCETKYYGPYADYMQAEDKLGELGALGAGVYCEGEWHNNGYKFIQELED